MGRRTQSVIKTLVFVLLFLASFATFGQCSDSIKVINTDSCTSVQMSAEKFTEFYLVKKNFDLLKKEIPGIQQKVDSLQKVNKQVHENYQSQIDSTNAKVNIITTSLNDCEKTLLETDLENMYLTDRVNRLKKKQWKMFGFGSGTTALFVVIIKSLIR